jgi:hypothetical protein
LDHDAKPHDWEWTLAAATQARRVRWRKELTRPE